MEHTLVREAIPALLIDAKDDRVGFIRVRLQWATADPFAIKLLVPNGDVIVQWNFDRQLLCDGLAGPSGIGDLRIYPCRGFAWPGEDELEVQLYTNDGSSCARLVFMQEDILNFLLDTDAGARDAEKAYLDELVRWAEARCEP